MKFNTTDISIADPESPNGIFHSAGYTRETCAEGAPPKLKRFYKDGVLMIELKTHQQAWHYIETHITGITK